MVKLAVDFPQNVNLSEIISKTRYQSVGTLLKVKAKWVQGGKQALSHVRQKQP